jgi:hypothetical protein
MRIFGYNYKLKYSPSMENGGMDQAGRLHTVKQIINVDPDQHRQSQESTVLHEVLEAINYHLQFSLPHEQISGLETSLYQFLGDIGMDTSLLLKDLDSKEKNHD